MGVQSSARRRFTWSDYRSWDDENRWELIGGEAFCMSPAPSSRHQAIVGDLFAMLHGHFKDRSCRPFVSPIDVKLSAEDVVQPDVAVVCDPGQVTETHIEGPPALVIEVLSPSSHRHDRVRKLRLYARSGIREYWLIQPHPALVEVLHLVEGEYRIAGAYTDRETLSSPSFPELALDLAGVFTLEIPPEDWIDEIRESAPPYAADGRRSESSPAADRSGKVADGESKPGLEAYLAAPPLESADPKRQRYERSRQRHLAILEQGYDLGTRGRVGASREELHER